MGRELQRLKRRKVTTKRMEELLDHATTTLVVHYSCESFYDRTDGKTPRITSVAVRNLSSGQTDSFSIHHIAEQQRIPSSDIHEHYDMLEKQMLDQYFALVTSHQHFHWVHWNMRDVNYGFAAIEHRYRSLGGAPILIPEDRKFDLARALVDLHGVGYISHPRLENLVDKNKITKRDFLSGKDEAAAFEQKDYVKLHQSTLRKVDILANIFERTSNNSLSTNAKWAEKYGFSPRVLSELIKDHPIISILIATGAILTIIVRVKELV